MDIDSSSSGLTELFDEIVALIRDTPVAPELHISGADKLRMYGLYKQATVGPFDEAEAPSRFHIVPRAKYQAWADCRDMTTQQAMLAYVETTASHDHWLGERCREKLLQWKESSACLEGGNQGANDGRESAESLTSSPPAAATSTKEEHQHTAAQVHDIRITSNYETPFTMQSTTRFHSWLENYFGVRPLTPRGQLDISYRDLAFAAWQCVRSSSSMSRYCQLEKEIAQLWESQQRDNNASVITGLSVRSLLDLYLRAASFPTDSQIIMTPPINIPGMVDVLRHHNINVVPVDIPAGRKGGQCVVSVDVDAIKQALTEKTVAIMIVHPFGMSSTTNDDMKQLRAVVNEHDLHLLEDCAECFTGLGPDCYKGSPEADISFFSFGTIKTATALGGGIVILRNALLNEADKLNRMHYSLYKQQTATEYLWRVLWCILVRFIADSPLLYGLIFALLSWVGFDFDAIVSSSTRGFAPVEQSGKRAGYVDLDYAAEHRVRYIGQLRRRPSTALLSVLARRLWQSQASVLSVKSRVERCRYMESLLQKLAPNVEQPLAVSDSANTFWLFPIQVDAPYAVGQRLREQGFDVPRGLSQLECISKYSSDQETCCRSNDLMNRILYLPLASRSISKVDIRRMAVALGAVTRTESGKTGVAECESECRICKSLQEVRRPFRRPNAFFVVAVSTAFLYVVLCRCMPLSVFIFSAASTMLIFFVATLSLAIFAVVAMRCTMADFYLQSSECFAKYNYMIFGKTPPSSTIMRDDDNNGAEPVLNMDVLRIPIVRDTPQEGVVLLTGATGFIGRILFRDLLLHRKSLSIPGGVVVLCRSKRGKSARERIATLLDDPMFSFLTDVEKRLLVHVVEGDVTQPDVGLSASDIDEVCNKLYITHVIHCAASVSFTQTLKDAAVSNITSSLNLQSLTGHLKRTSARYVQISTAFVHGGMTGSEANPLPEQLHSLDGYDAADLYRSMLGTEYQASVAMNELAFPNTYTFSKCVCEHLLTRAKKVPTVIVRPSIVGPAVQQPFEGWAGDKPTTIVAAACLYMSYQWNLWCFGEHRVPYIPVDVVSSFILTKAFADVASANEKPSRECDSPAAFSSDDGFERVSQISDSSLSGAGDVVVSAQSSFDENDSEHFAIYNCAWDSRSPDSAMFSWIDYAVAVTQLGAILGHFSRLTAYIGLFVTVRMLPGMKVKEGTFRNLHRVLVQIPIDMIVSWFKLFGCRPWPIEKLSKLSAFLDLPLLFFRFMNNDFYFASNLVAPDTLDGEKYLFSCATAAERFVSSIKASHEKKVSTGGISHNTCGRGHSSVVSLGGAAHKPASGDLWWALSQPQGSFFIRLTGWIFRKILRASSVDVTVDIEWFSLTALAKSSESKGKRPHIVLAPNHRSFFDFFLISYLCFALPELHIEVPFIAAADDFERIPIVGWLAAKANAFFLKRGRGKADPSLRVILEALKEKCGEKGVCLEVFIEGGRSRDRRYLRPKTGLLR